MAEEDSSGTVKQCPYCLGEIPAEASKCQHCGEWVEAPPPQEPGLAPAPGIFGRFFGSRKLEDTLNEGVKIYAGYQIAMAIIGLIVFLIVVSQMARVGP